MKCQQCRKRLLSAERPELPGHKVLAHLAACPACRAFQQQIVKIEANVPRLPVPPSAAKARLLAWLDVGDERAQGAGNIQAPPLMLAPVRSVDSTAVNTRRRWLVAAKWGGALAAAVVLIACGVWLGKQLLRTGNDVEGGRMTAQGEGEDKTPRDRASSAKDPFAKGKTGVNLQSKNDGKSKAEFIPPQKEVANGKALMVQVMECDLALAAAQTVRERVEVLAKMADLLQQETQHVVQLTTQPGLAKGSGAGKKLEGNAELAPYSVLAGLYKKVIEDGVVPRAKDLPMAERSEVLKGVAEQLAKTGRDAEQLAKSVPAGTGAGSGEALRMIASAARAGDVQLRQLMQEAGE